jgi:hypothetical protein
MKQPDNLGPPSLKIDGFALWVHGRQLPESQDFYDGNWLNVTAQRRLSFALGSPTRLWYSMPTRYMYGANL